MISFYKWINKAKINNQTTVLKCTTTAFNFFINLKINFGLEQTILSIAVYFHLTLRLFWMHFIIPWQHNKSHNSTLSNVAICHHQCFQFFTLLLSLFACVWIFGLNFFTFSFIFFTLHGSKEQSPNSIKTSVFLLIISNSKLQK